MEALGVIRIVLLMVSVALVTMLRCTAPEIRD
jgi:hypothetical protein